MCLTLLQPHGLEPTRPLYSWDFLGKNTRVGCYFLLKGIFQIQGLNPCLLHWQQALHHLSHRGSPVNIITIYLYGFDHLWGGANLCIICVSFLKLFMNEFKFGMLKLLKYVWVWPIFLNTLSLNICVQRASSYEYTLRKRKWHFTKVCYANRKVILDGISISLSHLISRFPFPWLGFIIWVCKVDLSGKKKERTKKVSSKWL